MNIKASKELLHELVDKEFSKVKLQQAISLLTTGFDREHVKNIQYLSQAGGNVGFFFTALRDAQVYSPVVIHRIMGRKTHGAYYNIMRRARLRIENNELRDITKKNIHYKLAILLNKLVRKGMLPMKDEEGDPVPLSPHNCVIENPVEEILKLFKELRFNGE